MTPPDKPKPPPRPEPRIIYPPTSEDFGGENLGASRRPSIGVRFRASLRASGVTKRPKTLAGVLALVAAAAVTAALKAFGVDVHIPPELFDSFR